MGWTFPGDTDCTDWSGLTLAPRERNGACRVGRSFDETDHPDLKGIWGITSVSLPAAAKAVRDAGKAGRIHVTGLGLPDEMREFVHDGTVEKFILWDAVDLGYLTVHVARRLAEGTLPEGTHDFGRLTGIQLVDGQAILGPPLVFDKGNVDRYRF